MILTAEADSLPTDARQLFEDCGLVGCHSSRSKDLSVHASIDSTGYVRLLWELSEEDDKNTQAAIFEVKFGTQEKKQSQTRASEQLITLFTDIEFVALALEGSEHNNTEDNFVPTAKMYSRHKGEATGDQIRSSKTTVLCMPAISTTSRQ